MKNNRVGEEFITNEGYKVKIIEYFGKADCTVSFGSGLILYKVEYNNIKRGGIRNPLHKSVYNVGCLGIGDYKSMIRGIHTKPYLVWRGMLQRCYDDKCQNKKPTYLNCSVCPEWLNYQNFSKWFEKNYIEGFEIDKDLLIKGNKVYSPLTCCFLPGELNNLIKTYKPKAKLPLGVERNGKKFSSFLNKEYLGIFKTAEEAFSVYKKAKEARIKEFAEKWKTILPLRVYEGLIRYKI